MLKIMLMPWLYFKVEQDNIFVINETEYAY